VFEWGALLYAPKKGTEGVDVRDTHVKVWVERERKGRRWCTFICVRSDGR
jgi:hypothetical protein